MTALQRTWHHLCAGMLAVLAGAPVAMVVDVVVRVQGGERASAAAAWSSLALYAGVLLVPGAWVGAVLAGLARDWAPFELLEELRSWVELQRREEETARVSGFLAGVACAGGWAALTFVGTRFLVERIHKPSLEAAAVLLLCGGLGVAAWLGFRAVRRGIAWVLALREEVLSTQVGVCSLPALLLLSGAVLGGVVFAVRRPLANFLYQLEPGPLLGPLAAAPAAFIVLLVFGTDPGERFLKAVARPWTVPPLVAGVAAAAFLATVDVRDHARVREALADQHPALSVAHQVLFPSADALADALPLPEVEDPVAPTPPPPPPPSTLPATERPNILLLSMDTVRADALGAYGQQRFPATARLDALAARGTRFERAYSGGPCSSASFMAMLTSRLPSRIRGVTRDGDIFTLPARATTFATRMAAAGYHVRGQVPVIGNYLKGVDQGFHEFDDTFHYAQSLADHAIKSLDELPARAPWLSWVHFIDAHHPYDSHRGFTHLGNTPRGLYAQELAYMDQQIGRVLDAAKDRGLLEKTVVMVFADHGEAFGEHGTHLHGNSLHDEEIRVPLIVVGPGVLTQVVEGPASLLDLGPTLVELAGAGWSGPEAQGRSLVSALRQGKALDGPVLSEGCKPGTMVAIIDDTKLFYRRRSGLFFLYDLDEDPQERSNLFHDSPRRDELSALARRELQVLPQ